MKPLARSVWIAPAASTALEPSGIGQARTSSGPAVGIESEVADRRAGLEAGVDAAQDRVLALGRLTFGRVAMAGARLEPFDPALGHRQVGEQEFQVELLEIAGGVDAAGGMRVGRVLE